MFRPGILRVWRPASVLAVAPFRAFHATPAIFKAKKAKRKGEEEPVLIDTTPLVNLPEASSKFQEIVEKFTKVANEAKLGKTSPAVFDKLAIATKDGELPYTSVAQTAIKGRNFVITVFDHDNVQSIINAVLGSSLNLNPQTDPSNKQTLKVPLPPLTSESKQENAKALKAVFEKYKNGTGKSLAGVRHDVRAHASKITKKGKLSDEDNKQMAAFDKLHKQYVEKLTEVFKAAEKAITK